MAVSKRSYMVWTLSRFRAGDLVEVRSEEEILATLDQRGCLDGMPFMPEMLQYCGQSFRVIAVAHKTCDTVRRTWKSRRLHATVHLAGLRCDGSMHGGCEADCNLFWKDAWLKPAGVTAKELAESVDHAKQQHHGRCSETQLHASTRLAGGGEGEEPCYTCQATKLYEATEPLAWWDPRQYVLDVVTRNHSPGRVFRVLWLGSLRRLLGHVPFGYRLLESFHDWMHRLLTGRFSPHIRGKIRHGEPTPVLRLNLSPGELVRVKSLERISETLDQESRNRGLSFDPEMTPYCDMVFSVRRSVSRIIDEQTGKMLHMKRPCITLEGVVCTAEYSQCRLLCPRAIPPYWREIWLERIDDGP
jgi:hypothetical protein